MTLRSLIFILLISVLGMAACQSEAPLPTFVPTETPQPTPTLEPTTAPTPTLAATALPVPRTTVDDPANQAYVRVVHTTPDVTGVDVYVEGRAIAFNLDYGQATALNPIEAGEYTVRLLPPGERPGTGTPRIEQRISLAGGQKFILVFTGTAEIPILSLFTEPTEPLDAQQTRVNLIHAVARGPAITLQQNGVDLTAALDFGQQSAPVVLPVGEQTLTIQSGAQTITTFNDNLRERTTYTLVLAGNAADAASLFLIDFNERVEGRARLRFLNAAEPLGTVDVYLNDQPVVQNLSAQQTSEQQILPTGTYNLTLYPAGADPAAAAPLLTTQFNSNPDDNVIMLLVGSPTNARLLRYRVDPSPLPAGQVELVFVNPVEDPRNVRVRYANVTRDVGFGQVTQPVRIDAGVYDFFWSILQNDNTEADTIESAPNVTLAAGNRYLYIVTQHDNNPLLIAEPVGEEAAVVVVGEDALIGEGPPTIRMVNLVRSGEVLAFNVDGQQVVEAVNYGQASNAIDITSGRKAVTVQLPGINVDLNAVAYDFLPGASYNLYVYGENSTTFSMLITQNAFYTAETGVAGIRLVNISTAGGVVLSLFYEPSLGPVVQPTPDGTVVAQIGQYRAVLPPGVRRAVTGVRAGDVSTGNRIITGNLNLYVVDNVTGLVTTSLYNTTLQEGVQYDLIAYQFEDAGEVVAFMVSYPLD
ncbi:MAG: hypothetical protein OHK0046_04510 [Anaerolineae bacterium]